MDERVDETHAAALIHFRACAPCAARLRREIRMVAMLRALAAVPEMDLCVPDVACEPVSAAAAPMPFWVRISRRPIRAAAVAAAFAAAAVFAAVTLPPGPAGGAGSPETSRVAAALLDAPALPADLRIVDARVVASGPDDRLLAMMGGPEAVAARHSASGRW